LAPAVMFLSANNQAILIHYFLLQSLLKELEINK